MTDPFTTWSRLSSAWFEMAETGVKASRMVETSRQIATARTDMIGTAMRTPLQGDYAELGRMVPEKMVAFGKAAGLVGDEWLSMQTAFIAEAQVATAMTMRGRPRLNGPLRQRGAWLSRPGRSNASQGWRVWRWRRSTPR
jgi:hypothetical protein